MINTTRLTLAAAFAAAAIALSAAPSFAAQKSVAPLFEGMGRHHRTVTTGSKTAQRYFNQGLTLCYAFNHTEAIRSFRGALQADPDCAMAWWGIAFASGPHVNRPMTPEDNERAWNALTNALALKPEAAPVERAFIDAMATRYVAGFQEDRSALDKAFANAMRELVR